MRTAACGFADVSFDDPPLALPDPLGQILDPIITPVQDGLTELLGLLEGS